MSSADTTIKKLQKNKLYVKNDAMYHLNKDIILTITVIWIVDVLQNQTVCVT